MVDCRFFNLIKSNPEKKYKIKLLCSIKLTTTRAAIPKEQGLGRRTRRKINDNACVNPDCN